MSWCKRFKKSEPPEEYLWEFFCEEEPQKYEFRPRCKFETSDALMYDIMSPQGFSVVSMGRSEREFGSEGWRWVTYVDGKTYRGPWQTTKTEE